MHTIRDGQGGYESNQESAHQLQTPEFSEMTQGNTNNMEIDLMKDIIAELECSLNNEY